MNIIQDLKYPVFCNVCKRFVGLSNKKTLVIVCATCLSTPEPEEPEEPEEES